jgi:hypothetical protein
MKQYGFEATTFLSPPMSILLARPRSRAITTEAEFQKVFLPDDPKPFLVPKLITVPITTDKGPLAISSVYTADSPRSKSARPG